MTTNHSSAAVRVCAIADAECSRNCGAGSCKRERDRSVEQHEAAPADALPIMRKAFRVTEVSGDPDPSKQSFAMRFSFPSIDAMHAADDEWNKFVADAQHEPGKPEPRDAIARSKRILGLVDEYHESPTRDTRTALRVALMDEFQAQPRAEVTAPDRERRHWNPVYNTDPMQRACTELPDGYEIEIMLERDAGTVDVCGPDGGRLDSDFDEDTFDWKIHAAIDAAIDAARAGDAS
ncbi:MAG TPA: hypothetical protein VJR91_07800 [Burkholderia sp.]|nr:hypothetical protein [Burkholderia sp.]